MDEEYASEITQIAVARACVALGFKQCEKSVIESLADVVQHYIRTIGVNAQEQAEISGRVHAGIQDVIPILEYTRPKNTNWKEIRAFAFEDVKNPTLESTTKWCQPFPFEVQKFPVVSSSRDTINSNISLDPTGNIRDPYIPSHLPHFPPAHTYKKSSNSKKRSSKLKEENNNSTSDEINQANKIQKTSAIKSAQNSLATIEDSIDSVVAATGAGNKNSS